MPDLNFENLKTKTPNLPSLTKFYDILSKHDWMYLMSDDHREYRAGFYEREYIYSVLKNIKDQRYHDLFNNFVLWINGKAQKPEKPDEIHRE